MREQGPRDRATSYFIKQLPACFVRRDVANIRERAHCLLPNTRTDIRPSEVIQEEVDDGTRPGAGLLRYSADAHGGHGQQQRNVALRHDGIC